MESVLLTIDEVASLEGLSYQAIRKRVNTNKLQAVKEPIQTGRGYQYRISLSDLSEKAQMRYLKEQGKSLPDKPIEQWHEGKTLEDLSAKQREQVTEWINIIRDWQAYIAPYKGKTTQKTKEFIKKYNTENPDKKITERTLRHKWKLYREHGEVALADGRSDARPNQSSIPDIAWSVFLQWWLDEGQPTVTDTYRLLKAWAEMDRPELLPLPAVDSFYRRIKELPKPVVDYFRHGMKVFNDECLSYVYRLYTWLDSNDVWISDYHTLDFFVRDDITGKIFRPHVVIWMDVRGRKVLSMSICETANSDGVVTSFRQAVKRFGIPKSVYLDNGREYLVHDFGGRGRRKTDKDADYGMGILERLGVTMVNAKAGNAQAKVIERFFRILGDQFSRLMKTYCGSSPEKRPERLAKILKKSDNIPLVSEIKEDLWLYFEGWYNCQKSNAEGLNGKTPNECYAENLYTKRTATADELNLMLLRSARSQKVKRNGVELRFGEVKLWYYHPELVEMYLGKSVYLRYDPEDLRSVRVYDEDERFLVEAQLLEPGGYAGEKDKEAIKRVARMQKEQKERVKDYMDKLSEIEAPDPKDVLRRKAIMNIENDRTKYEATVLEPVNFNTVPALEVAAGQEENLIDIERMIRNARRGKGEKE